MPPLARLQRRGRCRVAAGRLAGARTRRSAAALYCRAERGDSGSSVTITSDTSYVRARATNDILAAGGDIDCAYADCPAGFLAVGGGYTAGGSVRLNAFYSLAYDADTWGVCAYLPSTELSTTLLAEVICLRAEPAGLTVAAKTSDYGPKKPRVRLPDK